MERFLGSVSGPAMARATAIQAWGRVSGSASPTLDGPSFGTSSITDGGVGLLDVTWTVPFSSSTSYAVVICCQRLIGNVHDRRITTTISSTAVRFASNADPGGGWYWIACGQ